jgi:hypothetical protein
MSFAEHRDRHQGNLLPPTGQCSFRCNSRVMPVGPNSMLLVISALQMAWIGLVLFGQSAWIVKRGAAPYLAIAASLVVVGCRSGVVLDRLACIARTETREQSLHRNQCAGGCLVRRWLGRGARQTEIAAPIIIMIAASALLMIWTHAPNNGNSLLRAAAQRWTIEQPGDNAIPLDFAKGDASGHIPTPLLADWLSSDRPATANGTLSGIPRLSDPRPRRADVSARCYRFPNIRLAWRVDSGARPRRIDAGVCGRYGRRVFYADRYCQRGLCVAEAVVCIVPLRRCGFSPVYYGRRHSFFTLD